MIPRRHLHHPRPRCRCASDSFWSAMPALCPRCREPPRSRPPSRSPATRQPHGQRRWPHSPVTTSGTPTTCSLDGAAYVACGTQVTYSALRTGTHTFSVRAAIRPGQQGVELQLDGRHQRPERAHGPDGHRPEPAREPEPGTPRPTRQHARLRRVPQRRPIAQTSTTTLHRRQRRQRHRLPLRRGRL